MKVLRASWIFLFLALAGALASRHWLSQSPATVFLLRGTGDSIEAFNLQLFLSGIQGRVDNIDLTPSQKKEADRILRERDETGLLQLSREVGGGKITVGLTDADENWPWFLGGGWKSWSLAGKINYFDNLAPWDRIYLNLTTETPPPPPFSMADSQNAAAPPGILPTPGAGSNGGVPVPGPLRVEILNGCGITNAADWAARRLKGTGIVIMGIANADNFHYEKTVVQSSAGVPVALEDALGRMGLSKTAVEESAVSPGGADVTVIVGRDYLSLRGAKGHERLHH